VRGVAGRKKQEGGQKRKKGAEKANMEEGAKMKPVRGPRWKAMTSVKFGRARWGHGGDDLRGCDGDEAGGVGTGLIQILRFQDLQRKLQPSKYSEYILDI